MLDGITDSMHMSLSKLREMVKDRVLVICPENGYRELGWKGFEEWAFMSGK